MNPARTRFSILRGAFTAKSFNRSRRKKTADKSALQDYILAVGKFGGALDMGPVAGKGVLQAASLRWKPVV